ncbi:hypothetical protein, partial [Bacteriovorax sp. DB6_IX]|uniref:hypothetical protein n=1 Tax=Bacteriovorax sp. DB6_IX TaxID=1353530 RepID=UPI00038A107F
IIPTTVGTRNSNAESIIRRNAEKEAEVEIDDNASPIQNIVSNIQTQRSAIDTQKFESTLARLQSQYDKLDGKLQGLSDSYKSKDSELSSSLGSLQKMLANVNDEVTVEEQKVEKLREQIKVKAQEVTQKKEAVAQQKRRAEQAKIKRLSPNSTAAKVTSSRAAPRVRTTASQGGGTPRVSVGSGGFGALPEISAREQYDLDLLALKKVSKPLSKGATPMNINQFSKVVNPDLTIKNGQEIPQEGVVLDDGRELTVFEVEEEGKQLVVKDRVAKKDVATGLNQQAKELKTLESEFYKYEQFMKLLGESQQGE